MYDNKNVDLPMERKLKNTYLNRPYFLLYLNSGRKGYTINCFTRGWFKYICKKGFNFFPLNSINTLDKEIETKSIDSNRMLAKTEIFNLPVSWFFEQ